MKLVLGLRPASDGGGSSGDKPDWSALTADPLYEIFSRLPGDSARLNYSRVCRSWRRAAAFWRPSPWLITTTHAEAGVSPITSFSWLSPRGRLLPISASAPEIDGLDLMSSSRGWLAFAVQRSYPKLISLYNPATKATVALPPLTVFKKWTDIRKIVLSADPAGGGDWAVLAVSFPTDGLAYYHAGDPGWTKLEFKAFVPIGAEFYNGKFHVAAKKKVSVCDFEKSPPEVVTFDESDVSDEHDDEEGDMNIKETYLVDCHGKLLLISVHTIDFYASETEDEDCGVEQWERKVQVHEVRWLEDKVVLMRMAALDECSMFLGRNHGIVLSPEEYPSTTRNCVYLIDLQGFIRVVHLEDDSYEVIPQLNHPPVLHPGWARYCWVAPRFNM